MSAQLVALCISRGRHSKMKRSVREWQRGADVIGRMDDGDGGELELANCRACKSTICRPVRARRR